MTTQHRFAIGIDLGATTVKTGLVSSSGSILYQNKFPAGAFEGPDATVRQISMSVRDVMERAGGREIAGIGVGAPGVIDRDGVVKAPPNFTGWEAVPLADEIRKVFGLPVSIENDANAAAIAESRFGAGKEYPDFLFVIWGTGVGGGVILDRKIYRGPTGAAGEIGHISVDHAGPLCNCGCRGCVEAYVGQRYLSQRAAERLARHPDSKILALVGGDLRKLEPLYISQAAEQGDAVAREILQEAGTLLGVALGAVMNVLDLRISIIGGGVSAAGAFVMQAIEDSVKAHVLKPLRADIRVLPATLGNNAGILGAAGLVL